MIFLNHISIKTWRANNEQELFEYDHPQNKGNHSLTRIIMQNKKAARPQAKVAEAVISQYMSFKLTSIFDVIFHWHINSISISQRIVHNLKIGSGSLLLLSISFVSVLSKVSFMVKTQVLSLISHLSAEVYGIRAI